MATRSLGTQLSRVALFGLLTGGLLAVPLVLAGEKRYGDASLVGVALVGTLLVWLEVPLRLRAAWRRLRAASRRVVNTPTVVAPAATPAMALRPAPARRYKPASRGRQVSAISALAARGRDAQSIARELRVPYDVVQFALQRRAA